MHTLASGCIETWNDKKVQKVECIKKDIVSLSVYKDAICSNVPQRMFNSGYEMIMIIKNICLTSKVRSP